MRSSPHIAFALAAGLSLAANAAVAQSLGTPIQPAAQQTADALQVCKNIMHQGQFDLPRLEGCLSALRQQTARLAEVQISYFEPFGDAFYKQPMIAGAAAQTLKSSCGLIMRPFNTEARRATDVILEVTGKVNTCLNAVNDSGHLREFPMPFDETRHAIVASVSNCVRGYADSAAWQWCADALTAGGFYRLPRP